MIFLMETRLFFVVQVVASAEFASGVAVLDDYVYWADWMHGQIFRSHLESGTEKAIVTGLASPVDVALDKKSQQIYWSDVGVGRTQRAFLEGGEVQYLVPKTQSHRIQSEVQRFLRD